MASTPDTVTAEPALTLTPPDPVPVVQATQAAGLVPVDQGTRTELEKRVDSFVEQLVAQDVNSPEFGKRVDAITAMGQKEIRDAAGQSNRFLDRPVRAMDKDSGVGKDLAELRRVVEASGMLPHTDFSEQHSYRGAEDQMLRPDLVVRLPGGKSLAVDAKAPLAAVLEELPAQRLAGEGLGLGHLEHMIVGGVEGLGDLLGHHVLLALNLGRIEGRAEHQVRQHLHGQRQRAVQPPHLETGPLIAGGGVDRAALGLDPLDDLARGHVAGALEHQMLQQVRPAGPIQRLPPRPALDGDDDVGTVGAHRLDRTGGEIGPGALPCVAAQAAGQLGEQLVADLGRRRPLVVAVGRHDVPPRGEGRLDRSPVPVERGRDEQDAGSRHEVRPLASSSPSAASHAWESAPGLSQDHWMNPATASRLDTSGTSTKRSWRSGGRPPQ